MTSRTRQQEGSAGSGSEAVTGALPGRGGRRAAPRLSSGQVWKTIAEAAFAIIGYVTPSGEPRSSGVIYKCVGRRLYVVVGPDSWKAKHIATSRRVAVTVPIRRGGLLSLIAPIPPATISFHASAAVYPEGSPQVRALTEELKHLLPAERRESACVIEIVPEGEFVTYAIGVSLSKMRDAAASRARAPVS